MAVCQFEMAFAQGSLGRPLCKLPLAVSALQMIFPIFRNFGVAHDIVVTSTRS